MIPPIRNSATTAGSADPTHSAARAAAVMPTSRSFRMCPHTQSRASALASACASRSSASNTSTPRSRIASQNMSCSALARATHSTSSNSSSAALTIVEKLSSVRTITAASLVTSVPVIPIAIPMSAFFSAGASLTPSPVIATMCPCLLSTSTSRTLCSGVTLAITPISSILLRASSSLIAPNSAPVMTVPSMSSWRAIADAVTAWSPVIIRTLIPAFFAVAMEALAAGRGGSTIPTRASSSRPVTRGSRSAPGSKAAGSKSFRAVAITRRPCSPSRWFSAWYSSLNLPSAGTGPVSASKTVAARARSWSGAPLTKQRMTSWPDSSVILWKVAISL